MTRLMTELTAIRRPLIPRICCSWPTAMRTGCDQERRPSSTGRVGVTGVVLTKADGECARGRGALGGVGRRVADCVGRSGRSVSRPRAFHQPRPPRVGACSAWATCCRSSRRLSVHRPGRGRVSKRRSGRTSSRSRISEISCGRSGRMGRSIRSWDVSPGMGKHQGAGGSQARPRRRSRAWRRFSSARLTPERAKQHIISGAAGSALRGAAARRSKT